jgi:hypothetical protein
MLEQEVVGNMLVKKEERKEMKISPLFWTLV